jgi:hypothetical protein
MADSPKGGKKPRVENLQLKKETVQELTPSEAETALGGLQGLRSGLCSGKLACGGKKKGAHVN